MGRYIDDILQPGEKVLYSTNAHWIFYLPAIAAWIVAAVLLVLSRSTTADGIVLLCLSGSRRGGARRAVLDGHGLVPPLDHRDRRHQSARRPQDRLHQAPTFEMSLDKVESVDVNQSILGRILNYGDVTILAASARAEETIKTIASPLAFRNHITAR